MVRATMSVYSRPLMLPSEAPQAVARRDPTRAKDVLLEHLARDIKQLQSLQSDMDTVVDMVTASNRHAQTLCEHLDHILMHGLRDYEQGYWPFVSYFTRSEATHTLKNLAQVTTNVGRGRAWLYMALNEQAMESYVRMFLENQVVVQEHYLRESFLRDLERLLLLLTLMAGLDFVSFDLNLDCSYLDYGASEVSSRLGMAWSADLTPDVEPSFISTVTPQRSRLESGSLSLSHRSDLGHQPAKEERLASSYSEPSHRLAVEWPRNFMEDHNLPDDEGYTSSRSRESSQKVDSAPGELRGPSKRKQKVIDIPRPSPVDQMDSSPANPVVPSPKRNLTHHLSHSPESGTGPELVVHMGSRKKRNKKKKRRKGEEAGQKVASEWQNEEAQLTAASGQDEEAELTTVSEQQEEEIGLKVTSEQQEEAELKAWRGEEVGLKAWRGKEAGLKAIVLDVPTPVKSVRSAEVTESIDRLAVTTITDTGKDSKAEVSPQQSSLVSRLRPPVAASETDHVPKHEVWAGPTGKHAQQGEDATDSHLGLGANSEGCEAPAVQEKRTDWLAGAVEIQQEDREIEAESDGRWPGLIPEASPGQPLPHTGGRPGSGGPECEDISSDALEETHPPSMPGLESVAYKGPPQRPTHITEGDRSMADVRVDDNTRLVFQLDILTSEEKTERLVQVSTPSGVGQYRNAFVLITSEAVYLLRKDGTEGLYSKELGIKYSNLEHIVIGLGWQSLILVYGPLEGAESPEDVGSGKCVLLTGSEAVSKSLVATMRSAASRCPGFCRSLPLNRDDDARVEAIERELIKLGSQTSMDIVQYCLVNWEELAAPHLSHGDDSQVLKSGTLLFKASNMLGLAVWKQGYFELREGCLYQYNSEEDKVVRSSYSLWGCVGCTRTAGENKPFVLSVLGDNGPVVVLAAASEEELTSWMQALCASVTQEGTHLPSSRKTCLSCAVLLTQNKIHVLQEDWSNESVQLVASCEVTDVNDISVDSRLPLYCTISYDCGDSQGLWLLCFTSEYELGKFESALAMRWKELFQIDVQFSEVSSPEVRGRAHRAVELMQGSRFRSDSITRGRTEFSYNAAF